MVRKILVALDCSLHSRRAVEYTSEMAHCLPECQVTLLSILTGIPDNKEALEELIGHQNTEMHGAEDHEQEFFMVQHFLAEASRVFAQHQFPAERLTVVAKPLRRGIAQDILDEARDRGCDTVVVGKRELSKLQQVVLGSVSRALIQKSEELAIWVI